MKKNEPLNSSDIPDIGMTDEEYRLYREILAAAYPKPKSDIKSGVMDAIRAESEKKSDGTVIPMQKNLRKNLQKKKFSAKTFIRWGSLAASIVIIAAVGINVLPALLSPEVAYDTAAQETYTMTSSAADNNYDSAPQSAENAEKMEITEETADGETEVGSLYKSVFSGGSTAASDEDGEDPAVYVVGSGAVAEYTDDAAAEAMPEEAEEAVAEEAVAEEEAVVEDAVPQTEAYAETTAETGAVFYSIPSPDSGMIISAETDSVPAPVINCSHTEVFRDSYHEIPQFLIDEVGSDEYYAWANEVTREDSCAVNIYNFVHYFNISQAMFASYLTQTDMAYYCDCPIAVLYEYTAEEADEYYSDGGRYAEMVKDYFEYEFKLALVAEIGTEKYTEWLNEIGCSNVRSWSISQIVQDNEIDAGRFMEIYEKTAENFPDEYEGYEIPEYDLAKVYVPNAGIGFALAMSGTGYSADVACRK